MEDQKRYLAIKRGKKPTALKDHILTEEEKKEAITELVEAEKKLPIQKRNTAGDASESGLVKFVEPILGLDEYRKDYPTYTFE